MEDQQINEIEDTVQTDLSKRVLEKILSSTDVINVLPETAREALDLVQDPDVSATVFADLVQKDVKLSTDILSLANSVMYCPGAVVSSLQQAVARIGFVKCKNIILASSLQSAMQAMDLEEEWIREVLSHHGFLTGIIASNLNTTFGIGFEGEEFTGGLVHDFGRHLLSSFAGSDFITIDPLEFAEDSETLGHEESLIGTNHAEVGAWFLSRQGLPDDLVAVCRFHHNPELANKHQKLCGLVSVADHMANHWQRYNDAIEYDAESNLGVAVLEATGVGISMSTFSEIAPNILAASVETTDNLL